MTHVSRSPRLAVLGLLAFLLLAALLPARADAAPSTACLNRNNNTYDKLLECVTLEGVRAHQAQFQAIANSNDDEFYPGTRAAGTQGYADSVAYVAGLLRAAGYVVTLDEFEFEFAFPALLQQLTPVSATYATGAFTGSVGGDVTGPVIPVDIDLALPRITDSGCEAADFAGLDFSGPNDIALMQRGGPVAPVCTFAVKAANAEAAGAEAVVIFNQGNDPTREGLIVGTLGGVRDRHPRRGCELRRRGRARPGRFDRARPGHRAGDPHGRQRDRRAARHQRRATS